MWDDFTNLYKVTKTIKFELKPVGNTLAMIKNQYLYDRDLNTLMVDQAHHDSYQILKPYFDKIHERFIGLCLESKSAKELSLSDYFTSYIKDKGGVEQQANFLRTYLSVEVFKKAHFTENDAETLNLNSVNNPEELIANVKNSIQTIASDSSEQKNLKNALDNVSKFKAYIVEYVLRREEYYKNNGKATSIISRIVDVNLPKFCENVKTFQDNHEPQNKIGYLDIYDWLKTQGIETKSTDRKTGKAVEIPPITNKVFTINHFTECMSQPQIDAYNQIIGYDNMLINLYNQNRAKEKDFKKLSQFYYLSHQIGCSEKPTWIQSLHYDRKSDIPKSKSSGILQIDSVEEAIEYLWQLGKEWLASSSSEQTPLSKIVDILSNTNNWHGFYITKSAYHVLTSKYLKDWSSVIAQLNTDKTWVQYVRKSDEVKVNDVVELHGLLSSIDLLAENGYEVHDIFKDLMFEDSEPDQNLSPSRILIHKICADMQKNASDFLTEGKSMGSITDYKSENNKHVIKNWLDKGKRVFDIAKYFYVNEKKIKGDPLNPEFSNIISDFTELGGKSYINTRNAIRSYLTRQLQDDVQNNRLRLYFDIPKLLDGFVDSKTQKSDNGTQYGGYLFRKQNSRSNGHKYQYYLGISKKSKILRAKKNLVPQLETAKGNIFERLNYYQPKSTTYFGGNYSKNKEAIIEYFNKTYLSLQKQSNDSSEEKKDIAIKQALDNTKTTPSMLMRLAINSKASESYITEELLSLVDKTIADLKTYMGTYIDTNPTLNDITKKTYAGIQGFFDIVSEPDPIPHMLNCS